MSTFAESNINFLFKLSLQNLVLHLKKKITIKFTAMLSPDTLHHQEEVNSALDRQIRQDIQDMAQEAQIQAQIIAHEGK